VNRLRARRPLRWTVFGTSAPIDRCHRSGNTERQPGRAAGIPAPRRATPLRRWSTDVTLVLVVVVSSLSVGIWVTPMQQVSAAGQKIRVGAAAPSLSMSGPGQLDLFGQTLPTRIHFDGPVRPRLKLTRITLGQQLAHVANSPSGRTDLREALVSGWTRYFRWQLLVAGATAALLLGAVAGWQRRNRRSTLWFVTVGVFVTVGLDAGAVMFTAYTAPDKLRQVTSLQALVGSARQVHVAAPAPKVGTGGRPRLAVIGDSTAAGLGNAPLPHPSSDDTACRRSADAYALVLARLHEADVTNVACSGATIAAGLLGPQRVGDRTIRPQVDQPAVAAADIVIVSVGANDVHWSELLRLCAVSVNCKNFVAEAFFQKQVAHFSRDYLDLISRLQALPRRPRVIINLYYRPFTGDKTCLESHGVGSGKLEAVGEQLAAVNAVLSKGATAAGFGYAAPSFDGHGLCSSDPYVQGLSDSAPFHPTAAGELAIALADEYALSRTDAQDH
jgi:lysophospholipase L1-like esterase